MKYYGGIDLGGTNTKIGLLDTNANLIFSTSIKTEAIKGFEDTVDRICNAFKEEVRKNNINYDDIIAIGAGIPGPALDKRVCVGFANLPWPNDLKMADLIEEKLNKPCFIDNDVNVITLGENFAGAAKGYKDILCIAIGTGIGAGIISGGKIISGKKGAAGEIGHLVLVPNGMLCGCGHNGCFEAYASATGIERIANSELVVNRTSSLHELKKVRNIEAKDVFDAAKNGDILANQIVDKEADYLALGISHGLNLVNPSVVVLGGGVALAGDFLLDKVKKILPQYALSATLDGLEIKGATLGNDAGIYGAAYLAMTELGE
ncbi:ROK family protein [Oceanivirga miroungae]|uniref:Glucokinase n=1 Tax=Oceanivirga miroungae TaxID=1130046 RepID=A0A6I8M6R2_9FUSO|nr:ROK family protein [Oceanivirga miroungae]VWL85075.1 ROK family glucokinase [Oceanivirga miroungae]